MTEQLLQALRRRANLRGLVIVQENALLKELRISSHALRKSVAHLVDKRVIEILSPLPFLVVKWSGDSSPRLQSGPNVGPAMDRAYSFKSSLSQSKQMKESYRQLVEAEPLLQEILDTLGESDPTTFRGAVRSYSPDVIRTALDRIRRMQTIRKSRTALFRFLLPRIAKEPRFN
jgi:hypothetical protein